MHDTNVEHVVIVGKTNGQIKLLKLNLTKPEHVCCVADASPLRDDDVSAGLDHGHPVGVEQLSVPLAHLSKLEFEPSLLVKYLDSVVVGVRHNDVVLSIDRHSTGLSELALKDPEFSKLAVVDHLLPFDLRLERVEARID